MKPSSMKHMDLEDSGSLLEETSLVEDNANDDNEEEEDMFADATPTVGNPEISSKRTTMAIRYLH